MNIVSKEIKLFSSNVYFFVYNVNEREREKKKRDLRCEQRRIDKGENK